MALYRLLVLAAFLPSITRTFQLNMRPVQAILSKPALLPPVSARLTCLSSSLHHHRVFFASPPSCSLSNFLLRTQQRELSFCCTLFLSFWQILLFGRDHLASNFFPIPLFLGFNLLWSYSTIDP
jgi:hypothetical protein